MIITNITVGQKNKKRLNIFLDGEFACSVLAVAALKSSFKIGKEISLSDLNELKQESEKVASMDIALKYLSFKPVSKFKMQQYLTDKGFELDIAVKTVDRLSEMGYLNDADLAVMYARSYSKKYGNALIKHKLRSMGILNEDILDALPDEQSEADCAVELCKKYLKTHKSDKNKLYAYLSNKGFSSSAIMQAMGLLKNEEEFEC